jgi:hypothetical protein
MTRARRPDAPEGLRAGGEAFWTAIVDQFELHPHELVLLREAARTIDLLDALQAAIDQDGVLQPWGEGVRQHPAVPAVRDHRVALARLLASLGIPADPDDDRPSPRGGARGTYRMGSK